MVDYGLKVAPISFHSSGMGDEPFMTEEADQRLVEYGIESFPTLVFDGVEIVSGGNEESSIYTYYKPFYDKYITIKTPMTIAHDETVVDNKIVVAYTINKLGLYDNDDNLVVHTVLVENKIEFDWMTQDKLDYVERAMYPSPNGEAITFTDGVFTSSVNVSLDGEWATENLRLVSFIQNNTTGEILDADYYKLPAVSKDVKFIVSTAEGVLEGANVEVDGTNLTTDASGEVVFTIDDIVGEYNYWVSKEGYETVAGAFDLASTELMEITLVPSTGINDSNASLVSVYPNPTFGTINIAAESINQMEVYNMAGSLVERVEYASVNQVTYDMSSLEEGVYFITVQTNNGVFTNRIVKK